MLKKQDGTEDIQRNISDPRKEIQRSISTANYNPNENIIKPNEGFSTKARLFFIKIKSLINSFIRWITFAKKNKDEDRNVKDLSKKIKEISAEYINNNKVPYLEINTDPLIITDNKTQMIKKYDHIPMCNIDTFMNMKPKKDVAQVFMIMISGKPGHAMCGFVSGTGRKYILDNNGFRVTKTPWKKQDFIDNNIDYIEAPSKGNNWCGPATLENIKNICNIYCAVHKAGIDGTPDFSGVENQELLKSSNLIESIKNDAKIFFEKQPDKVQEPEKQNIKNIELLDKTDIKFQNKLKNERRSNDKIKSI